MGLMASFPLGRLRAYARDDEMKKQLPAGSHLSEGSFGFVALGLVNYLMFGLSFFIVIESRFSAFFGHEIGSAHTQ